MLLQIFEPILFGDSQVASSMQLIVFINIDEAKLFTALNSRYSISNPDSW